MQLAFRLLNKVKYLSSERNYTVQCTVIIREEKEKLIIQIKNADVANKIIRNVFIILLCPLL